jgi:Pregnancy-associated plasma protein-A
MSPATQPRRRTCAHMVVHELLAETEPAYRDNRLRAEERTRSIIEAPAELARVTARMITIPVVVHVVYRRPEENISAAQVRSQIAVLNRDFRAKNPDKKKVPDVWKSLLVDANIRFELAKTDPKGNSTSGITRTATTVTGFGADNGVKSSQTGGVDAWPADRYLNIWVCNLGGGLLGYAQFPGGPAKTDGVVVLYTAFGTKGAVRPPFDEGRTATHEVGHFLGLRHIWGDLNDCSGSDFVSDTPAARQANTGKPKFPHITCNNGPNGDMFMNYMDYVDDAAMFMFTSGQVARMNATLAGPRKKLAGL